MGTRNGVHGSVQIVQVGSLVYWGSPGRGSAVARPERTARTLWRWFSLVPRTQGQTRCWACPSRTDRAFMQSWGGCAAWAAARV